MQISLKGGENIISKKIVPKVSMYASFWKIIVSNGEDDSDAECTECN